MLLSYRYKDQLVLGEVSNLTLLANVTSSLLITFLTVEERQPRVVSLPSNVTVPMGLSTTEIPFTGLNAGKAVYQIITNSYPRIYFPMDDYLRFAVYHSPFLHWISIALGWSYFICWNISFYPQLFHNYLRKSTEGYSCDRVLLNLLGYTTYSAFKISLYCSPYIQHQYFSLHPGGVNPVRLNDVIFGVHGLMATLIILFQVLIYSRGFRVSLKAFIIFFLLLLASSISVLLASLSVITWLNCLYVLSYVKLIVSLIKYVPQIWIVYKAKSTAGLNIGAIWLDAFGGIFSTLQMVILAYNSNDWSSIVGNLAKFLLGLLSVGYSLTLITQHYVLYPSRDGAIRCFGISVYAKKIPEHQRLMVDSI